MTEKDVFAYKLFLSLNVSDFNLYLCENFNPPSPWKSHPLLKVDVLPSTPLFKNLVGGWTFPCRKGGGGCTLCYGYWPCSFLGKSFINFFWACHISKKSTRTYKYHAISRFIDDFCEINDDGEFSKSFKCIYPRKLELKLEHGGTYEIFLDLKIKFEDGIFFYKLSDKRDKFLFFVVRMPLSKQIPSTIFNDSIFSEFLSIARCTLKQEHFLSRPSELYSRMLSQGVNQSCINKQILENFQRYPDVLKEYCKNYNEHLQGLKKYLSSKQWRSNQYFLFIRFLMENVLITSNHCLKHFYIQTFVHDIHDTK